MFGPGTIVSGAGVVVACGVQVMRSSEYSRVAKYIAVSGMVQVLVIVAW